LGEITKRGFFMFRELTQNELATVSGGLSTDLTEVYPASIPGYTLVGWTEQIVGWDTYSWREDIGLFTTIEHVQSLPIVDILPLYMPTMTTTTVLYY
jgi:bacteriocin-like protein